MDGNKTTTFVKVVSQSLPCIALLHIVMFSSLKHRLYDGMDWNHTTTIHLLAFL